MLRVRLEYWDRSLISVVNIKLLCLDNWLRWRLSLQGTILLCKEQYYPQATRVLWLKITDLYYCGLLYYKATSPDRSDFMFSFPDKKWDVSHIMPILTALLWAYVCVYLRECHPKGSWKKCLPLQVLDSHYSSWHGDFAVQLNWGGICLQSRRNRSDHGVHYCFYHPQVRLQPLVQTYWHGWTIREHSWTIKNNCCVLMTCCYFLCR